MDFKIGVLVTTTFQQAHSQLIVTIGDHNIHQWGKQTKLQNLMLVPFEKNDANNSTIHVAIATKALIVIYCYLISSPVAWE